MVVVKEYRFLISLGFAIIFHLSFACIKWSSVNEKIVYEMEQSPIPLFLTYPSIGSRSKKAIEQKAKKITMTEIKKGPVENIDSQLEVGRSFISLSAQQFLKTQSPGDYAPAPSYSFEAYEMKMEGVVRIKVSFNERGEVTPQNYELVESSGHEILDDLVKGQIYSWKVPSKAHKKYLLAFRFRI